VQPGVLARRGRGVDRLLHVPALMSWRVIAAMTGATNRPHSRRWVSACLADHGLPVGCRAGDRYQAIRSAPAGAATGGRLVIAEAARRLLPDYAYPGLIGTTRPASGELRGPGDGSRRHLSRLLVSRG
jgi:hypothetical protein